MKTSTATSFYISHNRAQGMRFRTEDAILKAFCRAVDDIPIASVQPEATLAFLDGGGPVTDYWAKKYHVLSGLYRFALAQGWVSVSPLPRSIPRPSSPTFVPYIYSHAELKRMLDAIPTACTKRCAIDGNVFRALLLLLYGAGLRLGEALALTLSDVDLQQAYLDIREAKFYKHRLVPMGTDLTHVMREYVLKRNDMYAVSPNAPLFCCRDGSVLSQSAARNAFRRLRAAVKIEREGGSRRQPRLHDMRHTAAVHRLISWYRGGVDLQDRLPKLATYLGHVDLSATQRYLTMTPELLSEASRRFEIYAMEVQHD
jgi:integrase/recombinase XerD